jgi:hypothetical protein
MAVIPHPPYSPDLELLSISKNEIEAERSQFDMIEEVQAESRRELDTLTEKDFQEVFKKWRRQDWCLHAGGNYFEGDGSR